MRCMSQKCRTVTSLILAFIECLLFATTFIGWPNLVVIFESEGYFSFLCDSPVTHNGSSTDPGSTRSSFVHCAEQGDMFTLCFTIAAGFYSVSFFVVGTFFDRFGFWWTRISGTFFFVTGGLLLSFSSSNVLSYLIFPGLILMSVGSVHITVTAQHLTLQAGDKQSTITTINSGGMDCSVAVFLIVKLLYEELGISHKASLGVVTGLWSIALINTFLFCPKFKVRTDTKDAKPLGDANANTNKANDPPNAQTKAYTETDPFIAASKTNERSPEQTTLSFRECVTSPYYYLLILWCSLLQLRNIFAISSVFPWLMMVTGNNLAEVSQYTSLYSYISFGGILVSPLVGIISDLYRKRSLEKSSVKLDETNIAQKAKTMAPVLWIAAVVTICHSAVAMIETRAAIYTYFVLLVFVKSFYYGTVFAYVANVFPVKHYGKCLGLAITVSGLFALTQNALFVWANNVSTFQHAHLFLLVLMLGTIPLPLYIEYSYRKHRKQNIACVKGT